MANDKNDKDIAIVGMSCYFPGAKSIQEFWNNLENGVSSITDVPGERIDYRYFINGKPGDPDRFYFNKGGFVPPINIDPLRYGILPIAAEGIDPDMLTALYLAKEALIDAGVYEKNISLEKCCFVLGKGNYVSISNFRIGGYTFLTHLFENFISNIFPELKQEELKTILKNIQLEFGRYQADTAVGSMPNMIVSLVANKFNLRGPAYTIDGACASSLLAVEHASNLLLSGQCDIALTGGMQLGQGASYWSVFNVIGAASGKGQIAPFSEEADGLLIGEGAGIIVLKKLDKAIADNDRIYAVIKACCSGSDGSDVSAMAPSSKGQVATLKLTWEKAGMDPKRIGYIEAHGTATQVGDRAEIKTLIDFFGDNTAPPALLGAVKSNIGHAMSAAGIVGLIKTALALYYKKIPPTLHCEKPMKAMYESRFLPVQQLTDWDEEKYPLVAGVNAFGFGGINTHAILEPYRGIAKTTVSVSKTELTGIKEESRDTKKSNMLLPLDFNFKTPDLQNIIQKILKKTNRTFSDISAFSEEELEDTILQEANNNLREIAALQKNMLEWYRSNTSGRVVPKTQSLSSATPVVATDSQKAGNTFEKTIRFDMDNHPYLLDHVVVRQPDYRPVEESNPVVPFTMTIETLCEYTQELIPLGKILRVSPAGVYKWIQVKKPFVEKMSGYWKTDDCISWTLQSYAYGNITVGDAYPIVPDEYTKEIDLGDNISLVIPDKKQIYSRYLFHGPHYQTILKITKLTKKGIHAYIQKSEGKGSLLDSVGQLLGLYCYLILEERQTSFPLSVEDIIFYQDFYDQDGIFECTIFIIDVKDQEAVCNTVIKRDNKIWAVVKGWRNLRLNFHQQGIHTVRTPEQYILAERLNKNVFYYYYESEINISFLDFLFERYLNLKEREHHQSLYLNQARNYLISRVALKDGVRKYIQKDEEEHLLYPIEISVRYNEQGKPCLYGHERLNGIEVSIAHKGSDAVVMVSDQPVGIDIEKIEAKTKEFMELAFTPHELDLLKEKGEDAEWITRFWVAKEAYSKMTGLGLQGNPKQFEIESVTGEDLNIKNTIITTAKHRNDFIIGWTH